MLQEVVGFILLDRMRVADPCMMTARQELKKRKELGRSIAILKACQSAAIKAIPPDSPLAIKSIEDRFQPDIRNQEAEYNSMPNNPAWQSYLDCQEREWSCKKLIRDVVSLYDCTVQFPDHWL